MYKFIHKEHKLQMNTNAISVSTQHNINSGGCPLQQSKDSKSKDGGGRITKCIINR